MAWAPLVVLAPKKDRGVCFCADYRQLNAQATFDAYPMPRMEEIVDSVGAARVMPTLDLAKGYWQIPMSSSSREKTTFVTPFGLYEFEVMPFGQHNTPATFQRLMDHVLRECQGFSSAYMDDIIGYSQSWAEHIGHLRDVFHWLVEAGLHVKISNCQFGRNEVNYLGHLIGQGQIELKQFGINQGLLQRRESVHHRPSGILYNS